MADFVITHRIEAPEITAALNNLADALKARPVAAPVALYDAQPVEAVTTTPAPEKNVQAVSEAPVNPPVAPVTNTVNGATPATTTVPAPVTAAPSDPAPAKTYTFEDITAAGSQLLELGKMNQLMELLKGYGVQAVTQLRPEQYADVAAGLRGLGAKI